MPPTLAQITDEAPRALLNVIAAAVDPLEIAASLETCGYSNAVVKARFKYPDVFSLAQQLYTEAHFKGAAAANPKTYRLGDTSDLGRGLVFATPTLMFASAAVALHAWLSWWTMPLALICGWAFGQVVAYTGFSRQSRNEPTGSTVMWGLLAAFTCCLSLGVVGDLTLGGRLYGVLAAVVACVFMTASAELIARSEERLIGVMLLPGALGSLIYITRVPFVLPARTAAALAAVSVIAVVIAALWNLPKRWWRVPALTATERPAVLRYFINGMFCGLFVALFIVLEPARIKGHAWPAAAVYPMICSLGIMEWQLRSMRARARHALLRHYTLQGFVWAARRALFRSTLLYVVALAVMTALVQMLAYAKGTSIPASLTIAGTVLAVAFFLALAVASCGRIDWALRAWAAGLCVLGAWDLYTQVIVAHSVVIHGVVFGTVPAFCVAISVVVIILAVAAQRIIADPVSYG
jgi:hypothetical protein